MDRSYYNNSEVVKAMNVALDTAEAVEGRFFTSINNMNTFLKNMTIRTNNQVYDNIVETRVADAYNYPTWVNYSTVESVYVKEEYLTGVKNALKEIADGGFWITEETVETFKETLTEKEEAAAEAKEKYEAAEAFKAAIEPALETKAEAIEALAEAWEKYNNVDGLADAVETAEGNVEDAEEALEDAEEALEAAQEELDEVKAIQPDLKALTDAVAAAEDVVEAKEEAKDDAVDAAADAQDAYDEAVAAQNAINQTQKPVEYAQAGVVVAQAYTALTAANAAVVEAQAAIDEAEALVVEAQAELDEFVDEVEAEYNITLTGTAAQIAEAIANKVAQLEVNVYNKDVAKADAVAALAAAEAALAAAEAAVVDPDEAAEALVAADAAAKAAEAAVLAIITDEAYEVLELEEFDGNNGNTADYITMAWNEAAFNNSPAKVLVYKDSNPAPDKAIDPNTGLFTDKYASEDFAHTGILFIVPSFVENLENALQSAELAVAIAKDNVATAEFWVDQEGNDIRNEWFNNWDAKVAELNEWVEAKNAEIATVQAAVDAYNEAKAAAEEAEKPVIAIEAEANALLNMISSNVDLKAQIQSCESDISWYKLQIEQIKDGIYTAEAAVEAKKVEIANLETKIAYLEKLLESAKAQLDAAVAADQAE